MSVVELGHITIRKAVAVRFGDIGHRFQKLMSLRSTVRDQLHEKRLYTTRPKPAYGQEGLGWDPRAGYSLGELRF